MALAATFQLDANLICARLSLRGPPQLVGFGGDDCAVHILAFGDANRLARLTGHTTAVTAVAFDQHQQRVIAGSDSGSIRLWDLNTEQPIRSFGNGHRTTVTSVDYHAHGEFVATASKDTHLRIWDVRKKSCLQSYKGVDTELTAVQFCPSGRWVASGGKDGAVRLYDLMNGQIINTFSAHSGPITSIQFHPEQYLLVASSLDGTVSLWELDKHEKLFQSTGMVQRPVLRASFAGSNIVSAQDKLLRVYPFEGMSDRTATVVEAPWMELADLQHFAPTNEMLSVEIKGKSTSMFRIPLKSQQQQQPVQQRPAGTLGPKPSNDLAAAATKAKETPQRAPPVTTVQSPLTTAQQTPINVKPSAAEQQQQQQPRAAISMIPTLNDDVVKPGAGRFCDEQDVVDDLTKKSPFMVSLLHRRLTHARVLRTLLPQDTKKALEHLQKVVNDGSDGGVVIDFLIAMQQQRLKERITFETLPELLSLVVSVVSGASKQDPALLAALRVTRSMNTKFRTRLDEVLRGAAFVANGVDLSMEARMERCRQIQERFDAVAAVATSLILRRDTVGDEARTLLNEMPTAPPKKPQQQLQRR